MASRARREMARVDPSAKWMPFSIWRAASTPAMKSVLMPMDSSFEPSVFAAIPRYGHVTIPTWERAKGAITRRK